MNAAQRRQQRRQVERNWPIGTRVHRGGSQRVYVVTGHSRWAPGIVNVAGESVGSGTRSEHYSFLTRVPK